MKSEKKYFKNKNTKNSAIAENLVFVRTKKALGQNFLKSEPALRKIIEAGEIKSDDVILEIPLRGLINKQFNLENMCPAVFSGAFLLCFKRSQLIINLTSDETVIHISSIIYFSMAGICSTKQINPAGK